MIDWKLLGNYIRNARINKKLSQRELSKSLGMAQVSISLLETNKHQTKDIELLTVICKGLDINIVDLLLLCKVGETVAGEMLVKTRLMNHYKLNYAINFNKSIIDWRSLKQTIKKLRIEKEWTQEKLANLLKVDNSAICKIESDTDTTMRLSTLDKLCKVLNIEINTLLKEHTIKRS